MIRIKLPRLNKQLVAVALLGLILAFGAGLGVYTRFSHKNAPKQSLEALKSSLSEVLLSSDALEQIDGATDTSPSVISNTMNAHKNALDNAKKLLGKHRETLSENYLPLEQSLTVQSETYETLDTTYERLRKAVTYNPSLDLSTLDIREERNLLHTRSQAAYDNLYRLAEEVEPRFSRESMVALNTTVNCFAELADLTKNGTSDQTQTVRQRCINTYPITRSKLVSELFGPLSLTPNQNAKSTLEKHLKKLP